MAETNEIRTFEDLTCWQACRALRKYAAKVGRALPKEERYRLTDQILRSCRSSTANIAEGYGRYHFQENVQFCRQARGSLYETLDHFITGNDEGLISDAELTQLRELFAAAAQLLNGYINYLCRSAAAAKGRGPKSVREAVAAYGVDLPPDELPYGGNGTPSEGDGPNND